jgi:hypothetical protein
MDIPAGTSLPLCDTYVKRNDANAAYIWMRNVAVRHLHMDIRMRMLPATANSLCYFYICTGSKRTVIPF